MRPADAVFGATPPSTAEAAHRLAARLGATKSGSVAPPIVVTTAAADMADVVASGLPFHKAEHNDADLLFPPLARLKSRAVVLGSTDAPATTRHEAAGGPMDTWLLLADTQTGEIVLAAPPARGASCVEEALGASFEGECCAAAVPASTHATRLKRKADRQEAEGAPAAKRSRAACRDGQGPTDGERREQVSQAPAGTPAAAVYYWYNFAPLMSPFAYVECLGSTVAIGADSTASTRYDAWHAPWTPSMWSDLLMCDAEARLAEHGACASRSLVRARVRKPAVHPGLPECARVGGDCKRPDCRTSSRSRTAASPEQRDAVTCRTASQRRKQPLKVTGAVFSASGPASQRA